MFSATCTKLLKVSNELFEYAFDGLGFSSYLAQENAFILGRTKCMGERGTLSLTPVPIAEGRVNDRPVVVESTDNAVRFGTQRGQNTELGQQTPQDNAPHPQTEVGPSEDTFAVYQGRADRPLERSPIWRYVGKDALRGPSVPAVAEFRKLVEETQKQQKSQP